MSSPVPPRFVPTLTEVVSDQTARQAPAATSTPLAVDTQASLVQHIMQQVDLVLERRLREAVSRQVLVQSQVLTPRLREEIESLVRHSVAQALAPPAGPLPPGSNK